MIPDPLPDPLLALAKKHSTLLTIPRHTSQRKTQKMHIYRWTLPNLNHSKMGTPSNKPPPSLAFTFPLFWHVNELLAGLHPSSVNKTLPPLRLMMETYGDSAVLFLLKTLLKFNDYKLQLVFEEIPTLSQRKGFHVLLTNALESLKGVDADTVSHFFDTMKLTFPVRLLAILSFLDSVQPHLRSVGAEMISMLEDISENMDELSESAAHRLLVVVRTKNVFSDLEVERIVQGCKKKFAKTSALLLPLLQSPEYAPFHVQATSLSDASALERVKQSLQPWRVIQDIGYTATSSKSSFVQIIQQFPALTTYQLAQIISQMCQTHSSLQPTHTNVSDTIMQRTFLQSATPTTTPEDTSVPKSWRVDVFVDTINECFPKMDWNAVFSCLDNPQFFLPDEKSLFMLIEVYRLVFDSQLFPVSVMFGDWKNKKGQFSLIMQSLQVPATVIDFGASPRVQGPIPDIQLPSLQPSDKLFGFLNHAWTSLDLVESLLRISQTDLYPQVEMLIFPIVEVLPEILLCILSQLEFDCALKDLIISTTIGPFLIGTSANSTGVLCFLWNIDSSLVVDWMVRMYLQNPSFISRVLDITQDLKITKALNRVLQAQPFVFAIDLATLASRREFLNLQKWLQIKCQEHGAPFLMACVEFLREAASKGATGNALSPESLAIFFNVLHDHALSPEIAEELKDSFMSAVAEPSPESIEKEANSYFQKIYEGSLLIPDLIEILKHLKDSSDTYDINVFKCMIHSLFDEYRFFPKYPSKELQITGILFGTLIANDLFTGSSVNLALKCILESLSQSPDTKLFRFGIFALQQFSDRIQNWPTFALQLQELPHIPLALRQAMPHVLESAEGLDKIDSDTLLTQLGAGLWDSLDSTVKEQLSFVINTISSSDVGEKAEKIAQILLPPHYSHFAHYFVCKRAATEPNNHELYLDMMEKLHIPDFQRAVLKSCYKCINFLLSSDLVLSSGGERNLLKHLGLWLGEMTVARNLPVFAKYLNMRKLILDGYLRKRMAAVIPLVCKVLLGCAKSVVFKPLNPWLQGLLSLLVETYQLDELRLNIKFEIEVLFNRLQIDLDDVPVRNAFLKVHPLSSSPSRVASPIPSASPDVPTPIPRMEAVASSPQLKEGIETALENTIKDIVAPVVERSAHIACITTKELVLKDFVMESDEQKLRKAAHLMVQNLTLNLALFTGKEPLRASFTDHLKTLFPSHSDETVAQIVQDNLDFALSFLESAARERSIQKIDEQLLPQYKVRKTHREQNLPFVDASVMSNPHLQYLPDSIRPTPDASHVQMAVYEEFGYPSQKAKKIGSLQIVLDRLDVVLSQLDHILGSLVDQDPLAVVSNQELLQTIQSVSSILLQLEPQQLQEVALNFARKVLLMLLESGNPLQMEICLLLLKAVQNAFAALPKELTILLLRAYEELIPPLDSVAGLLRRRLLFLPLLDQGFEQLLVTNPALLEPVLALLERSVLRDRSVPSDTFGLTVKIFDSVSDLPEPYQQVLSQLKPSQNSSEGFTQQSFLLFDEWLSLFVSKDSSLDGFYAVLEREGLLQPEKLGNFLKIVVPVCIQSWASTNAPEFLDALCGLVLFIQKRTKCIASFLQVISVTALDSFDKLQTKFSSEPFLKLILQVIETPKLFQESLNDLCALLHKLRPSKLPPFAFSWLRIIAHRVFLPALLLEKVPLRLKAFHTLLCDLLGFLGRFLRKPKLNEAILHLYKGTLRLLLVLLHDFPEFLCEFHHSLCDLIPTTCVQLRNLVLSAFPRNMRLPDPFLPNLKIDLLPEIKEDPVIVSEWTGVLRSGGAMEKVQMVLQGKLGLDALMSFLFVKPEKAVVQGSVYDISFLNALVLYIGVEGIEHLKRDSPSEIPSTAMAVFQGLLVSLDQEGRFHLLNAIANQLRYPNTQTHYFSCMFLFLFSESDSEAIREQITKVLLERLIVHRPHPWGLLITFIELIKNPRYHLLSHDFTKCAPEIENLFESVARSCVQNAAGEKEDSTAV